MIALARQNLMLRQRRRVTRAQAMRRHIGAALLGRERYAKDHPDLWRGTGGKKRREAFVQRGEWPHVH